LEKRQRRRKANHQFLCSNKELKTTLDVLTDGLIHDSESEDRSMLMIFSILTLLGLTRLAILAETSEKLTRYNRMIWEYRSNVSETMLNRVVHKSSYKCISTAPAA
jgi:hypothetical protein